MDYIDFAMCHGIPRRRDDKMSALIKPAEKGFNILSNVVKEPLPAYAPAARRNLKK